jgi:hypothetical protein
MKRFLKVDLNMFNDAGSAQAGAPATNTGSTGTQTGVVNAPQQPATPQSSKPQQPLANVVYGIQAETTPNAPGADGGTAQTPDRKTEYARFKDQYKDIFQGEVEAIIKDRFKKYNGIEQQFGQINPLINMLMEQHGVKDLPSLQRIVENNSIESIADRDGLTVEQAREVQKLRRENEQLRNVTQSGEQERIINQRIAEWQSQAKAMEKDYPDFNLDAWADNEKFMQMLSSGIDVKTAYEVCDISNVKANVAKQMERNVLSDIQARGSKKLPENGVTNTPGMTVKSSVGALTRDDRAEIARRVARGEQIQF